MTTNTTRDIRITLDGSGMGPGSTYADAQAYETFVDCRLTTLYPTCRVTVRLAPEGQVVSTTVELDESEHQDAGDTLARLWDEFCADTTLWPSTQIEAVRQ